MTELTDTTKIEFALNKCMNLFHRLKHRSINKGNYEKAAKIREYENMCKDALHDKAKGEFMNIIVSKTGASITVSATDLVTRLGLLALADHNIHVMSRDIIKHYKMNKETP